MCRKDFNEDCQDWSSCFGLFHISMATILIGIGYLFICVVMLVTLIVLCFNQQNVISMENSLLNLDVPNYFHDDFDQNDWNIPGNQSNIITENKLNLTLGDQENYIQNHITEILIVIFMLASVIGLVMVMIYGAMKKIRWCLLPFFCWQIVDLIISILCIAFYFWYIQPIRKREFEIDQRFIPYMLLDLSNIEFFAYSMLLITCILLLKIYAVYTVYRCFKYLSEDTDDIVKLEQNEAIAAMLNDSESTIFVNERYECTA